MSPGEKELKYQQVPNREEVRNFIIRKYKKEGGRSYKGVRYYKDG